ncbi:diguanylate cyclase/phosphodiesterase [Thermocrinis albus DSM 14484]|uniref:Diguanylate cyclase/phosphodiesterase n=1 Tax=Thermocrinis albus (strain DSM 14484 / JCM 11386 / HI 11/12) TaxID=638303 RepID=D3SLA5_THEAH|nr:GGDEF domain-containing phosphodiesterase [Thermocrinis albus]ADC89535.1 diguanylate cyclase/phosphodiesterase [Thermocrinis albus DSM 14484]
MSLKVFIIVTALTVSVLSSLLSAVSVYRILLQQSEDFAIEASQQLAHQTFQSMYQIMRRGWTRAELLDFTSALEKESGALSISVHRGRKVTDLFGPLPEKKHPEVEWALSEGKDVTLRKGSSIVYVKVLKARRECLACHANATEGDVLGAVRVEQNLSSELGKARKVAALFSFGVALLPLSGAIFVILFLSSKLNRAVLQLERNIGEVNKISDLSKVDFSTVKTGFQELDKISRQVEILVEKLKKTAVDKEVLEFEMMLLEKFIITSEVLTDWQEFIVESLKEVSRIIKFAYFFTVFMSEENSFEAFVFWNCHDTETVRTRVEEDIRYGLEKVGLLSTDSHLVYHHRSINGRLGIVELDQVEVLAKKLVLERPIVGGAVGIGVYMMESKDLSKRIAVESLLSTLLNVIGSVKAIHRFTKEIEYYATRDPLTELYNQRVFWELLSYEVDRARRHQYKFALLVVDVDNFKVINDSYGHTFGDMFLRHVAALLLSSLRREDIVARYGGDEFVAILPYTDETGAYTAALRILDAFEREGMTAPDGRTVRATASIGVAVFPDHGEDPRHLFSVADEMMYKVKRSGKHGVRIPSVEDLDEIAHELARKNVMVMSAVEEGRVIPYFQPIADCSTLKVVAYEVLARIEEKDGSVIPAGKFIDIAESLSLVFKLDLMVFEKACRVLFDKFKNDDIKLFFNISPKALVLSNYLSDMKRILREIGLDPARIVFEITERETVRNLELLKKFVAELKMEGFQFAIDDFGSGFSSFAYVKHFPIDYIKVEGEFVRELKRSRVDYALVNSAVTLARILNIKTIAEFVESSETLDVLRAIGVDMAQGFYIGKPLRPEDII